MPADLKAAGQSLWKEIIDSDPPFELRPDEMRILIDACHEADMIDLLEATQAESPLTVKGSQNQIVINPLIPELRFHRSTLMALLKALKLPDAPSASGTKNTKVSEQARAAARARWGGQKGA
jgi:hypothetical protein